jgi:hypothetical protein
MALNHHHKTGEVKADWSIPSGEDVSSGEPVADTTYSSTTASSSEAFPANVSRLIHANPERVAVGAVSQEIQPIPPMSEEGASLHSLDTAANYPFVENSLPMQPNVHWSNATPPTQTPLPQMNTQQQKGVILMPIPMGTDTSYLTAVDTPSVVPQQPYLYDATPPTDAFLATPALAIDQESITEDTLLNPAEFPIPMQAPNQVQLQQQQQQQSSVMVGQLQQQIISTQPLPLEQTQMRDNFSILQQQLAVQSQTLMQTASQLQTTPASTPEGLSTVALQAPAETVVQVQLEPARTRRKKDPDRPKQPMSAYNFFFQRQRVHMLGEDLPGEISTVPSSLERKARLNNCRKLGEAPRRTGFKEMAVQIGKHWKELDGESRAVYQALADRDTERYRSEMSRYLKKVTY